MTGSRYRKPVRDPVAGILSDWFGIENGSAKMLWALYNTREPLSIEQVARITNLSLGSVTLCSGRLRKAGIELPSQRGRRTASYQLTLKGRSEVREALAWTARLLGSEVPDMERHEALEHALGLTASVPREYGLTPVESTLYGLLTKARVLSKERAFVALYGHLDEPPQEKIIDVLICKARKKLALHGIGIEGVRGMGWRLVTAERMVA